MKYDLVRLKELFPPDHIDEKTQALNDFVGDRRRNLVSDCDGGQLVYNVLTGDKAILFDSHLGTY